MNYAEQMQKIWKAYEDAGMPIPATTKDVAAWAIKKGLWKPRPADVMKWYRKTGQVVKLCYGHYRGS